MLTPSSFSSTRFSVSTSELSNKNNTQLATRLKLGSCTKADEIKINSLLCNLNSEESQQFFNDHDVQRELLEGFLDETITDERIKLALEKCTPSIKPTDQIDIIQRKAVQISALTPEQAEKMAFAICFFGDLPEHLQPSIARFKPASIPQTIENITPPIVYSADDAQSAQYAEYIAGSTDEFLPFNDAERREFFVFEEIALYVAGTAHKAWDIFNDETTRRRSALEWLRGTTLGHRLLKQFPKRQEDIAWAIYHGQFGKYPYALQVIANNLSIFTAPKVQRTIALAIFSEKFGTDPNVLQAIANNLGVFTDPDAQMHIALAIRFTEFCTDPNVLRTIANNLGVFTGKLAQSTIALAIKEGKFGADSHVLQAIADNLGVFTAPAAQKDIASAIRKGRFGTDPNVLRAVANNLGVFTYPQAQIRIALAIKEKIFGTDLNVLQTIANNLGVFTCREAQMRVAFAIQRGKFGTTPNVLSTIFNKIVGILAYQEAAIWLMPKLTLTLKEKISILSRMKFSLSLPTAVGNIPTENLPNLFGAKAYLGSEVIRLLKTKFSTITNLAADAIDPVCYDNQQYALQLNGSQLILYPLTTDQAEFKGWITSDNSVFYKQCVTNVTIFDFSNLKNGYPTIVKGKDLSPSHTLFATLPGYLKQAIRDNHFKPKEFRHHGTIEFVTQILLKPLMQKDRDLATRMQSIMQSSIVNRGDCVAIAASHDEDANIKNAINGLCQDVANTTNFNEMSKTFFNALPTIDDKARLAVLFGTMAKRGVLGYEYGGKNQANNLLYSLAKACFDNLKGANNIAFPENFHAKLANGICIEDLTNRFIIANSSRIDFHDVFVLSADA